MADDRVEKEMVNADQGSDELEKGESRETVEAEMKQSFEEMETEIEQLEEEKKGLESVSARAVELEGEVAKIHEDLVNALRDGDEREVTAAELKKELSEKVESKERIKIWELGFEKQEGKRAEGMREKEKSLNFEMVKWRVEDGRSLLVLNERIMEEPTTNGVRDIKDCDQECSQLQWPVAAAGSVGALGLVAATVFVVCYSKRT
ncbi:hypothetical protein Bca52824_029268 [Brassica carinata]|uniref:Uncharacterized protein n=1 Tax=Brassica carinata TaxID=52824 RepID=A0A8X8APJ0_BRACI|nr:hypothetical protein Bca52824_029268 [Brassica carinata]